MAAFLSLTSILDSIASLALVGWLLRITLLCAMACAFLAVARRLQPAMRHAVAVGSLVAVVLLPAASKLLPSLPVAVLPAPAPEYVATPVVADPAPLTIEVIPAEPVQAPATVIDVQPAVDNAPSVGAIDAAQAAPVRSEMNARFSRPAIGALIREQITSPTNWTRFALVLWVMVATALLFRLAIAFLRARLIADRAMVVNDDVLRTDAPAVCSA
jgi:hypothetical protein